MTFFATGLLPAPCQRGLSTASILWWAWEGGPKAAPPSLHINARLRKNLGWHVLGCKQVSNVYFSTKHNPADDPTRGVDLRAAKAVPGWLRSLVGPKKAHIFNPFAVLNRPPMGREVFAGRGQLSRLLHERGVLMWDPMEAYPAKGLYVNLSDVLDDIVFGNLLELVELGIINYLLFGLDCKSWGRAGIMNGGTRRKEHPDGLPPLTKSERIGNEQAKRVAKLCLALHLMKGIFTIENPHDSFVFVSRHFQWLTAQVDCWRSTLDQCAYGLRLPGSPPNEFCLKTIAFMANFPRILQCSLRCPGKSSRHKHKTAWGTAVVNGRHIKLAAAAGAYPTALCAAVADVVAAELIERFGGLTWA